MKRIIVAIHGLSFDGAEKVSAIWANALAEQGHQVAFLVHFRLNAEQALNERIQVYPIAAKKEDYLAMSGWQRLRATRKIVKFFSPDAMIAMLPKMQILLMLATLGMKATRFETVRNNPWLDTDVGKKRLLWDLCFRRSDSIILQTKEQANYFSAKQQKKCVVISNPILHVPEAKQYHGGHVKRFIAVGRVSEQKNYPAMIRAFAESTKNTQGCTLDIFGAGTPEYLAYIQKTIDEAGLNKTVKLQGRTSRIVEELLDHDAFLMSSNYEGMPNALAEAMATGLVCLSTDCKTGPKDMIEDGINGYLATTGSEDSFAEGIQKILNMSRQQCEAMGTAAREKILAMCSEENTLVRLKKLIESEL